METISCQALEGNIPIRRIGEDWRFLKVAVNNCLSSRSSRSILLQQAGALADDETLAKLRATIYEARGRSEVDEESL